MARYNTSLAHRWSPSQNPTLGFGLGLLAAALASLTLWYVFRSPSHADDAAEVSRLLKSLDKNEEDEELEESAGKSRSLDVNKKKVDSDGKDVEEPGTPVLSNTSSDVKAEPPSAPSVTKTKQMSAEKALHHKIEEIDKRGKALFKAKQFMEAADAFTEALDLIESSRANQSSSEEESTSSNSLSRQVLTLTNNRSAMYEKGGQPDLALHDCDVILEQDPNHTKARTRRLRILESQDRHGEALVEVCALQLRFMQEHRDKLRLGIPVTPPVPQTKIEDLMGKIVPGEVDRQLEKLNSKPKNERPLPSDHAILSLLKSFSGYNIWMADAARGGSAQSLTSEIDKVKDDSAKGKADRATLLLKRGRRYAYDRNFDKAKDDFDMAFVITEESEEVKDLLEGDVYARILEWVGMARHLRYDLDGALKCYERCSDVDPTNAEILVKRAGVKMDGNNHEEALVLFETALALDPDAVDALLHRANLRMLQQKPKEAKSDLERCLELRPDHLLARLRLATVLMATDDLDGAKKCLDVAEGVDSESSEVHSYRGEMHFAQGEFAEASAEFDKAIECESTNPAPYVNAALAVMNTPPTGGGPPDVTEAIRLLEKAVEVDPQFHAAYVHLGQLKLSMATDLTTAREVIALYDRGLEYCRTADELKDIVSMRILTVAQVDAASVLKMETLNMQ